MRTIVLALSAASLVLAAACGGSEKSGNTITQPPPAPVDTAPSLTLAFSNPAPNATVSEQTTFTLVASGGTPPYQYSIRIDTLDAYSGASASYAWQSRSVKNIQHTVTGLVSDANGKTATATETVTVSNFPIVTMAASADYALYCGDKSWAPSISAGISLGMTAAASLDGGKSFYCKVSPTDTTAYAVGYPPALASSPVHLAENIFIRNTFLQTTTTASTSSGVKLPDVFMFLIRLDPVPTVTSSMNVLWSNLSGIPSPGGAFDAAAKTSAGYVIAPMVVFRSRPCTTADSTSVKGNFNQVQTWSDLSKHTATWQVPTLIKVCR